MKASFRRALARRAQGKLPSAAADLRAVLAAEPNNAPAAAELEEVDREIREGRDVAEEPVAAATASAVPAVKQEPKPAPAPAAAAPRPAEPKPKPAPFASTSAPKAAPKPRPAQRDTSLLDASFGAPKQPSRISSIVPESARDTEPEPAPTAPAPAPSSFASLRQARGARPAYAGSGAAPLLSTTAEQDAAAARATDFLRKPAVPATPAPAPRPTVAPPPDPTSTAPGAGLALLRALRSLTPVEGQAYLRHYPAANVARITAPVLEPDSLGLVLAALGAGGPQDAEWTREVLSGLRDTPRWRMNAAMLSSAERKAGERAWALAGGEGPL